MVEIGPLHPPPCRRARFPARVGAGRHGRSRSERPLPPEKMSAFLREAAEIGGGFVGIPPESGARMRGLARVLLHLSLLSLVGFHQRKKRSGKRGRVGKTGGKATSFIFFYLLLF